MIRICPRRLFHSVGLIPTLIILSGCVGVNKNPAFDSVRAWSFLEYQVSLGPRPVGSEAHALTVEWIFSSLDDFGWDVEIQRAKKLGHPIQNIVAKMGEGDTWIILGAHYDTRLVSDQDADPSNRDQPVLGANDGASGVAVLLELARVLPRNPGIQIWLVFFDAEDNGNIPGWDWILGSRAFVESLEGSPDAVVILDMIADADLNIHLEGNSDEDINQQIWDVADRLGYSSYFIPTPKFHMLDDHTPFLEAGIPAVDIIDFNYPYWHTAEDILDNVSVESLQIVGETILAWLIERME
jgi:hypothetical protein